MIAAIPGEGLRIFDGAVAVQRAAVTGRLVCDGCARKPKPLAGIKLRFGDAEATTSATGAFSVAVTDRGTLWLYPVLPDPPEGQTWALPIDVRITMGSRPTFKLGTVHVKLRSAYEE